MWATDWPGGWARDSHARLDRRCAIADGDVQREADSRCCEEATWVGVPAGAGGRAGLEAKGAGCDLGAGVAVGDCHASAPCRRHGERDGGRARADRERRLAPPVEGPDVGSPSDVFVTHGGQREAAQHDPGRHPQRRVPWDGLAAVTVDERDRGGRGEGSGRERTERRRGGRAGEERALHTRVLHRDDRRGCMRQRRGGVRTTVCSSVKVAMTWLPPTRPVPEPVPARPPKGRWASQ